MSNIYSNILETFKDIIKHNNDNDLFLDPNNIQIYEILDKINNIDPIISITLDKEYINVYTKYLSRLFTIKIINNGKINIFGDNFNYLHKLILLSPYFGNPGNIKYLIIEKSSDIGNNNNAQYIYVKKVPYLNFYNNIIDKVNAKNIIINNTNKYTFYKNINFVMMDAVDVNDILPNIEYRNINIRSCKDLYILDHFEKLTINIYCQIALKKVVQHPNVKKIKVNIINTNFIKNQLITDQYLPHTCINILSEFTGSIIFNDIFNDKNIIIINSLIAKNKIRKIYAIHNKLIYDNKLLEKNTSLVYFYCGYLNGDELNNINKLCYANYIEYKKIKNKFKSGIIKNANF